MKSQRGGKIRLINFNETMFVLRVGKVAYGLLWWFSSCSNKTYLLYHRSSRPAKQSLILSLVKNRINLSATCRHISLRLP